MQVGYPDLVRKPPPQHAEDETNDEVAREAATQAFDTTGQNAHAVPHHPIHPTSDHGNSRSDAPGLHKVALGVHNR